VFVHGAGSSSLSFYYQLRHFRNSKGLDLPGHPDAKPCNSIEGYVEWVRGFNAARRYKDVVLCGHSMGGAIALLYALEYPQELRGLILLATGARLRVHPNYLKRCEEPGEGFSQWLEGQREYYKAVEADLYQALMRRAAEIGPAVELNDLLCCNRFDVMGRVHQIQLPTLVMCGSEDLMTPVKYADYLAQHIPGAREEVIPKAGHFLQLENYRQVNQKMAEFLNTLR
jgi:pimeloyl-ACP methyl ester carboxylesterase